MQILKFFFDKNFCFASNFVNKITLFLVFLIFTCTKSFLLVSVLADTKHILDNKTDFDANDTIIVEKDVKVNITPSEYIMVNIFRPNDDKEHPVVISYGPYDKDLSMQITNPEVYKTIKNKHQYLHMCTANPLWWVSNGYVIINASQSGSGKSSGILRFTSKHIGKDYAELIHWASQRSWSNGNIGLIGISQYAINQLHAASFQPAGLKAIIVWQAYSDLYRDISRHGGILSNNFLKQWFQRRLFPNMNKENRNESMFLDKQNILKLFQDNTMFDKTYQNFIPRFNNIAVPMLTVGFWDDAESYYLRGTIRSFVESNSRDKFLLMMFGQGQSMFYQDKYQKLQKQFFDYWLTEDSHEIPAVMKHPVTLEVVHEKGLKFIYGTRWPLDNTNWQQWYLDASDQTITTKSVKKEYTTSFSTLPDTQFSHVKFISKPVEENMTIAGPIKLNLWLSLLHADDADIFVSIKVLDSKNNIKYQHHMINPLASITNGWLRISHRELDLYKSEFWLPYHKHTNYFPVTSHSVFNVEIEIWPASFMLQAGDHLYLEIGGQDPQGTVSKHDDPKDRQQRGIVRIHTSKNLQSYILLPVIQDKEKNENINQYLDLYNQ